MTDDAAQSFITDPLASMVEATGNEVNVTLLVGGVVITGMLTSSRRYADWFVKVMAAANEVGGGEFDGATEPPTATETKEIADAFAAEWAGSGHDGAPGVLCAWKLCLRNAVVQLGPPSEWKRRPYLLVSAAHVGAFTAGTSGAIA